MHPVLAQEEFAAIECRRRQFLAEAKHDRLVQARAAATHPMVSSSSPALAAPRALARALKGCAAWFGPRPAPVIGKGTSGSSV